MQLIFSGGGKGEQTKDIDNLFLDLVGDKKVLLIPHAREKNEFQSSLDWVKENIFATKNYPQVYLLENLDNVTLKDLRDVRGIFIGGGNTFKLLNEIKKSKFDKVLKQFADNGGIIYGGSAGAIILTKNILTASPLDKNELGLKDLEGLNFFRNKGVFCHYTNKFDKSIKEISKDLNIDIFCLPEGSGLYIEDDKIKVIGSKEAFLLNEKSKNILSINQFLQKV